VAQRVHERWRGGAEGQRGARASPGEERGGFARGDALLEEPVADRRNWTIPRLRAEVAAREGVRISRSQLSKALHKKSSVGGDRGTR